MKKQTEELITKETIFCDKCGEPIKDVIYHCIICGKELCHKHINKNNLFDLCEDCEFYAKKNEDGKITFVLKQKQRK